MQLRGHTAKCGGSIPMSKKGHILIVASLIVLNGAFYLATLRSGQRWGDDFAQYIQEAKDIVNRTNYAKSYYIFDPLNPSVGPKVFPPGYPVLLSPVYAAFGLNLRAMKIENIAFFLGFMLVFYLFGRDGVTFPYVIAAVALVGFNPNIWDMKEEVISEFSYLFLLYLVLYIVHRASRIGNEEHSFAKFVLIAGLMFICYSIRSTGLFLVPALLFADLARHRRLTRLGLIVTGIFISLWVGFHFFSRADGGYLKMIQLAQIHQQGLWQNLKDYSWSLSVFWGQGISKPVRHVAFTIFTSLSAFGYLLRLKRERGVAEFYVPMHFIITVVWPYTGGFRYLVPIIPLYVLYACVGTSELTQRIPWKSRQIAITAAAILLIGIYADAYSKLNFGPITEGVGNVKTKELFQYVSNKTEPQSVLIFRKPKAMGLYTQRFTSAYPDDGDDDDIWRYIGAIQASYVITSPIDDPNWSEFIRRNQSKLNKVFVNPDFTVYALRTGANATN